MPCSSSAPIEANYIVAGFMECPSRLEAGEDAHIMLRRRSTEDNADRFHVV